MKIIYNHPDSTLYRPITTSVVNTETASNVTCPSVVNAVALFDTDCSNLTIQASVDNFSTFTFEETITGITDTKFVELSASVNPAKWRVLANTTGTIGLLYVGTLLEVMNPTYPWAFELNINADDRMTHGGFNYSKLNHQRREGAWSWSGVGDAEIASWRTWYAATNGFRRSWVAQDPLITTNTYLCKSSGKFPLTLEQFEWHSGQIIVSEVI